MSDTDQARKMNRREFLAYMMAGSVSLLGVQSTGLAVWFALPDFDAENTYVLNSVPNNLRLDMPSKIIAQDGARRFRFWLSYTSHGLQAFAIRCPFKEVSEYAWVARHTPARFICPDCGSRFAANGQHVYGPSPRNLDRYPLKIVAQNQTYISNDLGSPIQLNLAEIQEIRVNVGRLIRGQSSVAS